ncbi:hypothetical protein AB6C94_13085, partial [Vibrio splendidus]
MSWYKAASVDVMLRGNFLLVIASAGFYESPETIFSHVRNAHECTVLRWTTPRKTEDSKGCLV